MKLQLYRLFVCMLFVLSFNSYAFSNTIQKEQHIFDLAQIFSAEASQEFELFLQENFEKTYFSITFVSLSDSSIVKTSNEVLLGFLEEFLSRHYPSGQDLSYKYRILVAHFVKENETHIHFSNSIAKWFDATTPKKDIYEILATTPEERKLLRAKEYDRAFYKLFYRIIKEFDEVRPQTVKSEVEKEVKKVQQRTQREQQKAQQMTQPQVHKPEEKTAKTANEEDDSREFAMYCLFAMLIGFVFSPIYKEHLLSYMVCGFFAAYVCLWLAYPWRNAAYTDTTWTVWSILVFVFSFFGLIGGFIFYLLPPKWKYLSNSYIFQFREKVFHISRIE